VNVDLTLRDLTISGFDGWSYDAGGAVLSFGHLVVERCRFEENGSGANPWTTWGGAIGSGGGGATISDSIMVSNGALQGGAVFSQGVLRVERSIFESNSGFVGGGAIFVAAGAGDVDIRDSLFVDNDSLFVDSMGLDNGGGSGGALHFERAGSVVNSTLHANRTSGDGGAIWASYPVTVFNSTLTANVANSDQWGSGTGGGIYNEYSGGLALANSILAGNLEAFYFLPCFCWATVNRDCTGNILSNGFNIIQGIDVCNVTGASQTVDPLLLPLSYYGGSTRSREPGPGSPAINAGVPASQGGCYDRFGALATDQRGAVRPYGAGECDLGAVERGAMMFGDGFEAAGRWSAFSSRTDGTG
jgi:hypothetical protein